MRVLVTNILLLFSGLALGQYWSITESQGLNSDQSEILCTSFFDGVIYSSADKRQRHSDRALGKRSFSLNQAKRGATFDQMEIIGRMFHDLGELDVGTAHFSEKDSTLWFSTANAISETHRSHVGLYSCKWKGDVWTEAQPFTHNSHSHDVMHPWVSDKGFLYFSSNMKGSRGGMDIWYSVFLDDQWSIPVNQSYLNSDLNEVFPTTFADTVFFSKNGQGQGMEIYAAWKESQEGQLRKLDAPFNSKGDDFMLVWIDDELGFLTSNRGGESDDIYLLRKQHDASGQPKLSGLLECMGEPIIHADLKVFNALGEEIISDSTSTTGEIDLPGLVLNHSYKIQVSGVPKSILEQCVFFFVDEDGSRVRMFRLGKDGFFIFDFLPLDEYNSLSHLENVDQSVLTIPIQGQVFENQPGDLNKVQPVYIMDDEENLLALAYTSLEGNFSVPDIRPLSDYMFCVEEGDRELQLVIFEGDQEHVIPIEDGLAKFSRIPIQDAVRLVDENSEELFIREDEVFIIKNIYYRLDSANLNTVAEQQLGQLAKIMLCNTQVSIVLYSHTDSRGTVDYNNELSERRAQNAFKFLTGAQIEPKRIEAKGFGEMQLLNHCLDDADCDEKEHALNRRTEIKIRVNEGY